MSSPEFPTPAAPSAPSVNNEDEVLEPGANADDNSFADILKEFEDQHAGDSAGQKLKGTVLSIRDEGVFIDIGRKMEGMLPADLVRGHDGKVLVALGQTLDVMVAGRDENGYYRLSTQ